MSKGLFLALEGGDGAGKSTLARLMKARGFDDFIVVNRKQFVPRTTLAKAVMPPLREILWGGNEGREFPSDMWFHLQIAWHIALFANTIEPLLNNHKHVLVDGWIWKFIAKLMVQGVALSCALPQMQAVARPDHVILILQDGQKRLSHRQQWSATERGLHAGMAVDEIDAYVHYQNRIDVALSSLSETFGWSVLESSEFEDVQSLADRLAALLAPRLKGLIPKAIEAGVEAERQDDIDP